MAELLLAYFEHADRHYHDPDGRSTREIEVIIRSLRRQRGAATIG
jgi:hypothetical protein